MQEGLREQLINTARAMSTSGLGRGVSGNLSVRCERWNADHPFR